MGLIVKSHEKSPFTESNAKSEDAVIEQEFWNSCQKFQKDILVPGYWDTLEKNCQQWADEVTVSPFWKAVKELQPSWSSKFRSETSGSLLANPDVPSFIGKGKKRIMEKIFKEACRKAMPPKPELVWSNQDAPIPEINDLVRVRIECQFLDGVEYFADLLEALAKEHALSPQRSRQGKIEGYFAQHFYFNQQVFFRFGGGCQPTSIKCEIQVATALATRIWEDSHKVYEQWRVQKERRDDWQWNPKDPRFVARQLGHMIHLADGLLVQLRDTATQEQT
jgi:hypothetical protein